MSKIIAPTSPLSWLFMLCWAGCAPATAEESPSSEDGLNEIIVLGKRLIHESASATGLDLSLRETPQSVTVVTSAHVKEFALTDVNQLLASLPGINVEAVETDRTYYNSRGFDIINFQVDGVGQPLDWGLQTGALDVATYDRIEAVRGANGMMTGTGNPSATINYIRKRPTKDFRADVSAGYGTWSDVRLTADVAGPLNRDETISGRVVYARTDKKSYLDYYQVDRNVYYGVLSWDITPKLNATAGYSKQDNLATGNNWGALPLVYSDGTPIDYDRSANSGAPWTYWNTRSQSVFGEMSYAFDGGWTMKGIFTRKDNDEKAQLLYAFSNPDPVTGLGVGAMSGIYPSELKQNMFDFIVTGPVDLFGRKHQVVAGFNTSTSNSLKWEAFADIFAFPAYEAGNQVVAPAEPAYPEQYLAEQVDDKLSRVYAAAHLNFTDQLKGIVGVNAIKLTTSGFSYGVAQARSDKKVSPYLGAIYDINTHFALYGSYSDIFDPQHESDINRNRLSAAEGRSYEAGVKSEWLDRRLYATAAAFKSVQYGLADYAGAIPGTADSYYVGVDTFVKGYELEIAGRVTSRWTINGGWTDLSIKDKGDTNVRLYLPRRTLKLSTVYALPMFRDLRVGGAVRWQSGVETADLGTRIVQNDYVVVDFVASVRLAERLRASANVKNAFDQKYWGSLQWTQAFYAPPRSVMVSMDYAF
jgi:outer-membrane receptor for ferric coprogen and ferric-rhodotorulic acid